MTDTAAAASSAMPTVIALARFPVKGLTAQPLDQVTLQPDRPITGDRRFALAHGAAANLDGANPAWARKANFLTWVRNPRLAQLDCRFDADGTRVSISHNGRALVREADLTSPLSRGAVEQAVLAHLGPDETRGSVRVVDGGAVWFADVPQAFVSIQNAATLRDIGSRLDDGMGGGAPLDWRRLRGNLLVDGLDAWVEQGWVAATLRIGGATLKVEEIIGRCGATHVNPDSGIQDADVLGALHRAWGHNQCGVYARVIAGGVVRPGDRLERVY